MCCSESPSWLHNQEAQLGEVHQEVVEASRRNKAACATMSDQLDYIINRLQGLEQVLAACPPESGASAAITPEEPAPLSQPSQSQCLRLSSPKRFPVSPATAIPFFPSVSSSSSSKPLPSCLTELRLHTSSSTSLVGQRLGRQRSGAAGPLYATCCHCLWTLFFSLSLLDMRLLKA